MLIVQATHKIQFKTGPKESRLLLRENREGTRSEMWSWRGKCCDLEKREDT